MGVVRYTSLLLLYIAKYTSMFSGRSMGVPWVPSLGSMEPRPLLAEVVICSFLLHFHR